MATISAVGLPYSTTYTAKQLWCKTASTSSKAVERLKSAAVDDFRLNTKISLLSATFELLASANLFSTREIDSSKHCYQDDRHNAIHESVSDRRHASYKCYNYVP
jgi:hypothetical protein